MTVISAASMRCRTMADGSLRIECEVEPRFAVDAFTLFSSPGTPMALAALKIGAQEEEAPPQQDKPKGGQLAQWCAMRCKEEKFRDWLSRECGGGPKLDEAGAKKLICAILNIKSRAEIDSSDAIAIEFKESFMNPWSAHCKANGIGE